MPNEEMLRRIGEIHKKALRSENQPQSELGPPEGGWPEGYDKEAGGKFTGPCRELAQSVLRNMIDQRERHLRGLKALLAILPEKGTSDLEELVWEMLQGFNRHF